MSLSPVILFGQTVYRTPSGNKFHTSTCRFVKNVSHQLSVEQAYSKGLSPCSVCKPNTGSVNRISPFGLGIKLTKQKVPHQRCNAKGKRKPENDVSEKQEM